MIRTRQLVVSVALALVLAACNKPSDENCRKAITNMQVLLGTDKIAQLSDVQGEVRRCKGGSSREAVDCAMKATTIEELNACDFMKVPARPAK